MSRTLKRPMFRDGGRANSKGTGIMSGIEEREPYFTGGGVNRNTTLDPYLFSGSPSIMPPPSKELGFSQKLFAVDPTSPVGQLFKDSDRDKDTASEFTKFIEESRPEIRKEGTEGFRSLPTGGAEGLPIVTSKQTTQKEETTTPDLGGGGDEPTKIKLDDLDDFEANVDKKAEMFLKRLMPEGAGAQAVFKAFTAAADPLLRGEYGEAIKEAGEKLGEPGSLKEKVNLLAIQSELEDQKLRLKADLDKKNKVTANIADYEYQVNILGKEPSVAFQQVFGEKDNVQNREAIPDVRANSLKLIRETGTGVMKEYDTQYANAMTDFIAGGPNYIKYKKKDAQKPSTADNLTVSTPLAENQIYADPIFGGFAIMSGGQQLRFTTIEEAEEFIKQARG
tara:strand:- start:4135 stop:5313 length:1179 start_codon:yes stop_codon:yes gene_type:complete